ncbi:MULTISPECIES: VOC family protein [Yersinia]|uniref:VOC family protein n=1 Tax=Yersinia TaxID=629 RepID=UPI0005E8429C|nr:MULTISPECIES: VOC family protein [Yersinia]ARB82740.1 extradiol dioxygenase [Yersinia sp. FDAARGOS_228]AVL36476.1 extradiol dioxygenase [Yersinia intermedia]CND06840.1 Glyoxalase-like domain [Yersinia intermedia]
MADPNFIILYVDSPANSATFYGDLLAKAPVELHPTFAMFALDSGMMLGLWSKHTVEPAATATGGGGEVAFALADKAAVQSLYNDWQQRGLPILQQPLQMDFGYTFVALDPDGHRLRVFGD